MTDYFGQLGALSILTNIYVMLSVCCISSLIYHLFILPLVMKLNFIHFNSAYFETNECHKFEIIDFSGFKFFLLSFLNITIQLK